MNHEMLPVRDVPGCNPATCPLQPIRGKAQVVPLAGGIIRLQPLEKVAAGCLVQGAS